MLILRVSTAITMMLDVLMQHYVLVLSVHFTHASVIVSEMFTNVVAW